MLLLGGALTAILFETGSPASVLPRRRRGGRLRDAQPPPGRHVGTPLTDVPLWQLAAAWLAWVAVPTAVVITSYAPTKVSR